MVSSRALRALQTFECSTNIDESDGMMDAKHDDDMKDTKIGAPAVTKYMQHVSTTITSKSVGFILFLDSMELCFLVKRALHVMSILSIALHFYSWLH